MTENKAPTTIKKRKLFLHPATTFAFLAIAIIIISGLAEALNIQATYTKINAITGELEPYIVTANSLLNRAGIRYILSDALRNFVSFAPFIMLLLFLVPLGVLEKSGLLKTFINRLTIRLNKKTITFLLFLLGILLNLFLETAYVIMIPLSALLFLLNGRNPLVGVIVGFASVSFSFGINLFITSIDTSLLHYTNLAARVIDSGYQVALYSNIFIMLCASFLIALIGTTVTEKIIVKKLGKYPVEESFPEEKIEYKRKGFIAAALTFIFLILIYGYMLIPNLPYSGLLLDYNETSYVKQMFSANAYFQNASSFLLAFLLTAIGIAYGLGAKTFKNDKDIIKAMGAHMKVLTNIIIIFFFASQFIAYFKYTNIGNMIAIWGSELIKISKFSGLPLIILTLLVVALVNLCLTSTLTKWSFLSPVIVPILMQFNITPEFTQTIFKAANSLTNSITPLLAYFTIYIGFLNYYHPYEEKPLTIKKALSFTLPYTLFYTIMWILILVSWYLIGLPLGPNIYPSI